MKTTISAIAIIAAMGIISTGAEAACIGPIAGGGNTATSGCQNIKVPGMVIVTDGTYSNTAEPGMTHLSNGADHHTIITPDGMAVYDNDGITTVESGEVTIKGTKVKQTLDSHTSTLTTHTTQIAATNTRLNSFNGTGGSLEAWATGVDNTNAAQNATLNDHGAALASHQLQIDRLNGKTDKAFEGVAIALAMESPQVDPGKKFGISLNWGNFEGENAIAGAAKLRFDDTWAGTAGVGYGMGQNTLGVRAGVQAQW